VIKDSLIINNIKSLPDNLKQEVMDYIDYLQKKYASPTKTTEKKRVFGSAKGKYVLTADFNEPLKDFEEYM
jgi:hypothetical protein